MARHYKKWAEHSSRWQRQARKEGLTPQRWDGWLKLSPSTRNETNPRKYAAGQSVAQQRRERKEQLAAQRIASATPRGSRPSVIQRNVKRMSDTDLEWTLKASGKDIRQRASQKSVTGYPSNPWWYR